MTPRHVVLVSCAIVALAASATARADELPYRFTDTLVGSMIPQEIIRSPLPFDGRYADLTAAQKATLANEYESLPAGDEPPYPQYGLRHLVAPMVRYADLAAPVGSLVASVVVDSQGHAGEVTVHRSPDPALSKLVTAALALESWKPAVCSGQPCRMAYVLRLDFPRRVNQPTQVSGAGRLDTSGHSFNAN